MAKSLLLYQVTVNGAMPFLVWAENSMQALTQWCLHSKWTGTLEHVSVEHIQGRIVGQPIRLDE